MEKGLSAYERIQHLGNSRDEIQVCCSVEVHKSHSQKLEVIELGVRERPASNE